MSFTINPFSGELSYKESIWKEIGTNISPISSGRSISLASGAYVNEFSTDATLSGASDNVVPVESSVRTFVETKEKTIQVTNEDTDVTINFAEINFGKRNQIENSLEVSVNLPSISSADIGKHLEIVKLGAGNLIINAADSDTILTSAAGGNISNSVAGEIGAFVKLVVDIETKWNVIAIYGIWVVSS